MFVLCMYDDRRFGGSLESMDLLQSPEWNSDLSLWKLSFPSNMGHLEGRKSEYFCNCSFPGRGAVITVRSRQTKLY
jgi:hypothetical protein